MDTFPITVTSDPVYSCQVINVPEVSGYLFVKNALVRYMGGNDGTNMTLFKSVDAGETWTIIPSVVPIGFLCLAGFGSAIIRLVVGVATGFELYEFDTDTDTWSGLVSSVVIAGFDAGDNSYSACQLGNTLYVVGSWVPLSAFLRRSAFITYNGAWSAPVTFANPPGGALGSTVGGLVATATRVHAFVGAYETNIVHVTTGAVYQSNLTSGTGAITRINDTDFTSNDSTDPLTINDCASSAGNVCFGWLRQGQPIDTIYYFQGADADTIAFNDSVSIDTNPSGTKPLNGLFRICALLTGFACFFSNLSDSGFDVNYNGVGDSFITFIGNSSTPTFSIVVAPTGLTSLYALGFFG